MTDIDDKVKYLNSSLLSVFDRLAPLTTVKKTKPGAPWLTCNIKVLMKLRDKAKSRFRPTKSAAHFEYYKILRNYTTSAVRNEKKGYFDHSYSTKNFKHLWKKLRNHGAINRNEKVEMPLYLRNADDINEYFIKSIPKNNSSNAELINYFEDNIGSGVDENSFDFK
ncbi:hypothetical protein HHI36_009925 [Cryptolaemus montrouzieri]|uniref:Uncharacterized protein n=1 Tax=Cryptolaemus montrouzieri TaxID=559131 RepID=A0ABD2MHM7_9CUCU